MFKLKVLSLSIGCAGLLAGCALFQPSAPKAPLVQPVVKVQHSGVTAEAKYDLGRYYYGQRRQQEAMRALEEALALDAAHSRASNVLGVIYAAQGRYAEAEIQFRRALEREPHAAHVHNNLGYAYLLQGRNQEALESFEEALRFAPDSEKSAANLKIARERLGLGTEATEPAPAIVGKAVEKAEPNEIANKQQPARSEPSKVRMVEIAPNVYELVSPSPAALPSEIMPKVVPGQSARPAGTGVEVANGNGVTGMARQVASSLRAKGIDVARLTNRKPFNQQNTEIEYRDGFEISAREVSTKLPRPVTLVESTKLKTGINVRLVLGKDVSKDLALFELKKVDSAQLALVH